MTERIDHAAEARTLLGVSAVTQDAEAITHALLALAEQQRIANLFFIARETHADIIAGLEAMGLDENDFAVPLGLPNVRKADI